MEELKKDDLEDASAATEAGGEPGEGRRFRLSKRTLILGGAGLLILVLIVSGVFAYRASVKQKEVAQAQAEVKKRELALREEAAKREAEEARMRAEAGRKAHEEIMAASPPAASLPPPLKENAASAALPAVAGSGWLAVLGGGRDQLGHFYADLGNVRGRRHRQYYSPDADHAGDEDAADAGVSWGDWRLGGLWPDRGLFGTNPGRDCLYAVTGLAGRNAR